VILRLRLLRQLLLPLLMQLQRKHLLLRRRLLLLRRLLLHFEFH